MKHLKLFENENQKIWMYQETDDYSSMGFGISTYLFDNKEILFKFVLNKAYNIIESSFEDDEKEEYYKVLDECDNYESIIENISEWISSGDIDSSNRINVEIENIHGYVKIQDWIQERRAAKKYNL